LFHRESDENCGRPADCAHEAAYDCGRPGKRETDDSSKRSKVKRACSSLLPGEPPRGETAIALPARLSTEIAPQQREASPETDQVTPESEASRMDSLEADLTRLTLIVQELAKARQQDSEDLGRLTLSVQQLAGSHKSAQEDLARMSLLLKELADKVK